MVHRSPSCLLEIVFVVFLLKNLHTVEAFSVAPSSTSSGQRCLVAKSSKQDQEDSHTESAESLVEGLLSSASPNFVDDVVAQLWPQISLGTEELIQRKFGPRALILPGKLKTTKITKIDLGAIPFRTRNYMVRKTPGGCAVDFDLDWEGKCDMEIKAEGFPALGVSSITIDGRMTFLLQPLTPILPGFKAFHFAFINPPDFKLEFATDVKFSTLDQAVEDLLEDYLAESVVLPNRIAYNLLDANEDDVNPGTYSFLEGFEPPIGIARVSVKSGKGFTDLQSDVPDVYCTVKLGLGEQYTTSTVSNSIEPVWNDECADFMLSDNGQEIRLMAMDENIISDVELGSARITIEDSLKEGGTMELELRKDDGRTGAFIELQCETFPLSADLSSLESEQKDHLLCGVLVILVPRALNIPLPREEAATYVKVTYSSDSKATKKEFYTGTITDYRFVGADALNPAYDCAFHVPLTTGMMKETGKAITFELVNGDSVFGSPMGKAVFPLDVTAFVDSPDNCVKERLEIGDDGASLEVKLSLHGMAF